MGSGLVTTFRGSSSELVLDDLASLHHESDMFEPGYIVERILANRDDVREPASFNDAKVIQRTEQLRGNKRSRLDCLHRRHAVTNDISEIFSLALRPRIAACVRSIGDLDALL